MQKIIRKKSSFRAPRPVISFVCLLILVLAGCDQGKTGSSNTHFQEQSQVAQATSSSRSGAPKMPHFRLHDLNGNLFDSAQLKGKVTIINFWATWCIYCKIEIPDLNRLNEEYKPRGLEIVGISMDQEGPEAVIRFMKSHFIDYQVLMGSSEVSHRFGGIVGLPTTFIVDRDGTIVKSFPGFVKIDFIERVVKTLL